MAEALLTLSKRKWPHQTPLDASLVSNHQSPRAERVHTKVVVGHPEIEQGARSTLDVDTSLIKSLCQTLRQNGR